MTMVKKKKSNHHQTVEKFDFPYVWLSNLSMAVQD